MLEKIKHLLSENGQLTYTYSGITVVKAESEGNGMRLAKLVLEDMVDNRTLLLLSGGRTPWMLYKTIATEEKLRPGAVGMIDERYGDKWHEASNEQKLRETGLLRYARYTGIPVYLALQAGLTREETAAAYDEKFRELQHAYQKSVGIVGIGLDGHTAGIAGNREDFHNPVFDSARKYFVVSEFNDPKGMFKERVTLTFLGLAMIDLLIILVFGADKREALENLFAAGSEQDIPARFYKRPEIAKKTLLITDQKV